MTERASSRSMPRLAAPGPARWCLLLLASPLVVAQDFPVDPSQPPPRPAPVEPAPPAPPPPTPAAPVRAPEPEPPAPQLSVADWPPDAGPPPLDPGADPASPEFIGPPLVPPFELLGESVPPGSRAELAWSGSQSFAGSDVLSPVTVLHGTRPGPVLCLTAAVHGDEINGVEIVRRMGNRLEPRDFGGTVVAVPIVNLFGFSRNSRYLPDRRDLNRYFPGSRFGSIASRMAYSFFDNVVRHCHALVDFHTGSFDRSNLPQIRADLRLPGVLEFTRGFGATPVLHSDGSDGMLRVAATEVGIPAVTFEVGAPQRLQPELIEYGVQAVDTLLHKLGMVRERPDWDEPQPVFYDSTWVRADSGGLLLSDVSLGDTVTRGQRLGQVIDPVNNRERDIVSPVDGRVLGMALNQVVLPGFAAYHVGKATSEAFAVEEAASGRADAPVDEDPDSEARRESGDPDSEARRESGDPAEFFDDGEFE